MHRPVTKNPGSIVVTIEPQRRWSIDFRSLWQYHDLFYFLVWRDIKVRYKQTLIGAAWAIIQPLFSMVVFTLFFGNLANIPSDGIPYPVFAYAALVPWQFFASGVTGSSDSLVASSNMLKKVYFPRLVLPVSAIMSGLFDFLLAFAVLIAIMLGYGIVPGPRVVTLPAFLLLALVTACGVGMWLSALNVKFRDVRYTVPFIVQMWLFITPIAYPSSLLDEPWRTLYGLNPMAGVVEGFRWALLGADTAPGPMILLSAAMALVVLVTGMLYFQRIEDTFADIA